MSMRVRVFSRGLQDLESFNLLTRGAYSFPYVRTYPLLDLRIVVA